MTRVTIAPPVVPEGFKIERISRTMDEPFFLWRVTLAKPRRRTPTPDDHSEKWSLVGEVSFCELSLCAHKGWTAHSGTQNHDCGSAEEAVAWLIAGMEQKIACGVLA